MKAVVVMLAALATGVATASPAPTLLPGMGSPRTPPPAASPRGRLPGFAAQLEASPTIAGPGGWPVVSDRKAWAALAATTSATRQSARWAYARSLIGSGRGPEARGVLAAMLRDDADLVLIPAFRLADIAAAVNANRIRNPLVPAGVDPLATNPEACAWRLRAFAAQDRAPEALAQFACALPALNARAPVARAPFLLAASRAALAAGRPAAVRSLLRALPDGHAEANLHRGRAELALGDAAAAQRRLEPIRRGGNPRQRIDAELSLLEAAAAGRMIDTAMSGRVERLAYVWRGDALEQRALRLGYRIASERRDLRRTLAAGAALVRHGGLQAGLAPLLTELRALLTAGLAPGAALPIDQAAGIYWEYRDLAPAGAEGDFLASQLADRLQERGLYARAAELLRYQLLARTRDISRGPLSARVASLYILAGEPGDALTAFRATDDASYPATMIFERHRVEAVALYKLGRLAEALAVLQDVPGADVLRAEISWDRRDWPTLAIQTAALLPVSAKLLEVEQAVILRHAIALAMLGREADLAGLRRRYMAAFAGLGSAATFDLLTRDPATIDGDALTKAMLAIPSASPAGAVGDLFAAPLVRTKPI